MTSMTPLNTRHADAPLHVPAGAQAPEAPTHCFSLMAEADPGILPRVLELFAKRNLVPERWVSDRMPGGGHLTVDLQVKGLEEREAEHIARCLRQIWGVESVLRATKG